MLHSVVFDETRRMHVAASADGQKVPEVKQQSQMSATQK